MPDNETINPNLSGSVPQQGVADASGALAYSGISDSSTAGEIAFQGPTADVINHGVVNGAFAQGPPDSAVNIEPVNNPLPYWYGPVSVSGGAITASWVTNTAYPSGQALRMTLNAGAASDEAYFEQIISIGGSGNRWTAHTVRVSYVVISASATFSGIKIGGQYLTAAGATTGSTFGTTDLPSLGQNAVYAFPTLIPPADASYLRVRIALVRDVIDDPSWSAVLDVTDVRLERGITVLSMPDLTDTTKVAGTVYQSGGDLILGPQNGSASAKATAPKMDVNSTLTAKAAVIESGVITPTIAGTVNNWAPTGLATCSVIIVNLSGASRIITGFDATGMTEGQRFKIFPTNAGGGTLTLSQASGSSLAGNQMGCPNTVNYVIQPLASAEIVYLPSYSATVPFRVFGSVA